MQPPTSVTPANSKTHKHKKQSIKKVAKNYKGKLAKEKGQTTAHRASAIDQASAWPNFTYKDFMKFQTNLTRAREVSPSAARLSISFLSRPSMCIQPYWPSIFDRFVVEERAPKSIAHQQNLEAWLSWTSCKKRCRMPRAQRVAKK